jgi:hypothetical protein
MSCQKLHLTDDSGEMGLRCCCLISAEITDSGAEGGGQGQGGAEAMEQLCGGWGRQEFPGCGISLFQKNCHPLTLFTYLSPHPPASFTDLLLGSWIYPKPWHVPFLLAWNSLLLANFSPLHSQSKSYTGWWHVWCMLTSTLHFSTRAHIKSANKLNLRVVVFFTPSPLAGLQAPQGQNI